MLDGLRRRFARAAAAPSALPPASRKATMRYMRPDGTGQLAAWNPALRSKQEDVSSAWSGVSARAVEMAHNSGWISGAIDQMVADVNGPAGLTLNATPDADELGWSSDFTQAWSRQVERKFRAWAANPLECDVRGKQPLAAMAASAVRWFMPFGESCARIVLREKPGSASLTKIQMLSPHRLSQQTSELQNLHQGVFLDADGGPIGYRFRARRGGWEQDVDVPARDPDGRPLLVHTLISDPDQTRGISPIAPALKVTRQRDQLADATLTKALLQTIFAATFESSQLPGEALEGLLTDQDLGAGSGGQVDPASPGGMAALLLQREEWYRGAGIDLGTHGRIATTFPGDSLKFHATKTPGSDYLPFDGNLAREIARCIGTTYEAFSGDFKGATFSSLKMGTASVWPVVILRRNAIPAPLYQAAYSAWLEEQVARKLIQFPGGYAAFLRKRAAASQCQLRGPAKPSPDELKTAKALETLQNMGVYSIATSSAELGIDWESEQEQRAQERERIIGLGLPDPYAPKPGAAPVGAPEDPEEEEAQDNGPA